MQFEHSSSDFLDVLKCPITYELFRDPVLGADGHTYERENITTWIKKHASSPITREPMELSSLRPNYIVKKMVEDFVSLSLQRQYRFRLDVDICQARQQPIFQSPGKTIYEAKWLSNNGPPIVLIRIDGAKAKREASFYVKLSCHPHIVRTYGLVDSNSPDSIMLVQEYAPEGDLGELLRSNNFQPTLEVLIEIFWQIADAMICLADNQIIHGDLACRNVLVFRSRHDQSSGILVKLTDFGLTRTSSLFSVIDSPASSTFKMIPIRYAAPELLLDASPSSYTEKSDVYSFGVLMWEACSNGAVPYGNLQSTDTVYQEKVKGKLLERPNTCSDELWSIILNCTQQESDKRPNFRNVQEALLELRFHYKRESSNRMSQVNFTYDQISNQTLPENNNRDDTHYQSPDEQRLPNDSDLQRQTDAPVYQNLGNVSSDYYIPCEYCLQSINNDDFETHKEVCSVRRLVQGFAKMFVQLPLLEITSCQYCEYLIPLNMLNIHQNTCGKHSICLHNLPSNLSPQQPSTDTYETSIYMTPISLPYAQMDDNAHMNKTVLNRQVQNRPSSVVRQSEISSQSSIQLEPTIERVIKPPKTGLRKAFSKFKKKISS